MVKQQCRAERMAVEQFRRRMSRDRRMEVSYDEALQVWLEHHATQWRQERLTDMLAKEREEILRHKWIESEKAHRDLGAEAALDWIRKYAAQWRKWYDEEYSPLDTQGCEMP